MQSNNLYLIKHMETASEIEIECILDKHGVAKVSSAILLNGNVIPLRNVKRALEHYEEQFNNGIEYEDEQEGEEVDGDNGEDDDGETDEPA
jgi:hypothetical protein